MELKNIFNDKAENIQKWEKRNRYYFQDLEKLHKFLIPENRNILEIGCGTGDLLNALKPSKGLGIDLSDKMIEIAKKRHPHLEFEVMDGENIGLKGKFDLIILSNLLSYLNDIEKLFKDIYKLTNPETRIIISFHNYLWEPVLKFVESLGLRSPQPPNLNWLSSGDIENMLFLANFEVIKKGKRLLLPLKVPIFSYLLNRYVDKLPLINRFCLTEYIIARPKDFLEDWPKKYSVSIVVPARNEKGNIEEAVYRMPDMGKHVEIIFVEGNSTDDTWIELNKVHEKYKDKDIKIMKQEGKGKGDAVRKGFSHARGDVLMILDADLTVRPEDLSKFYEAIASGKGEFINGCRLVYQMEENAMRFLNVLGNKFFSLMFTWLLSQRFKDTLCGTKVLFKRDYEKIIEGRKFFGDFDPFGDFDLIFGASKLNLKIVELPIRYQERKYGSTNISRFRHGWLLLRMCLFAAQKIKFY